MLRLNGGTMPFFDKNPLQNLAFQPDDADATLDLRGISHAEALSRVESLLDDPGVPASYLVLFDRAEKEGTETLFLPLGRKLLEARRQGLLTRCLPIADGGGYFIAFRSDSFNSDN
jgi:hypothetical protein